MNWPVEVPFAYMVEEDITDNLERNNDECK